MSVALNSCDSFELRMRLRAVAFFLSSARLCRPAFRVFAIPFLDTACGCLLSLFVRAFVLLRASRTKNNQIQRLRMAKGVNILGM